MASCTQSDVVELVPNEKVEIKLTSSAIAAETVTRAPYEGTIGSQYVDGESAGFGNKPKLYGKRIVCKRRDGIYR